MKTLLLFLLAPALAAQPSVYYVDAPEVPGELGKTPGYVVLSNGDTLRGYLRNALSAGQVLNPRQIRLGNFTISLGANPLRQIAFWPDSSAEKLTLAPAQLRAFGFQNTTPQLGIELTAPMNSSGFIKRETLRNRLSATRQLNQGEDARADQRRFHDGYVHYEILADSIAPTSFIFAQRVAEGIHTLYFLTQSEEWVFRRRLTGNAPFSYSDPVRYDGAGRFLETLARDCPALQTRLQNEPELRQAENFVRVVGLTNLYCDERTPLLPTPRQSYVVTLAGDTLRGQVERLMASFAIRLTNPQGERQKLNPSDLRAYGDVTGYGTTTVYESRTLPGQSSRSYFCRVICEGALRLLENPNAVVTSVTKLNGLTTTRANSYLLQKTGAEPVLIRAKNFEDYFQAYFSDCPALLSDVATDASLQSYQRLEELVIRYNARCASRH